MAEILEQSEVDALLVAMDEGQIGQKKEDDSAKTTSSSTVRSYDFKRPERVSKDQIRALHALHDGFARNFGASVSGFMRTILDVHVASIEQLTYSEFINSLPNPTCFNLLSAETLEGQMCLEISPLIIYPIIDRLLGGSNAELFVPQRPLTAIELRLVKRITNRALENLSEVWSHVENIEFNLVQTESNPQMVQIVPPNEVVVVVTFEIKMGSRAGTMALCIPYNVVEPIMGELAARNWFAYNRKMPSPEIAGRINNNLMQAPIEIRSLLAQTTITVSELANLSLGDVIQTDRPANGEQLILVKDKIKFAGRLGQFRGQRAIKVIRPANPNERL